jgi:hypothetical protein
MWYIIYRSLWLAGGRESLPLWFRTISSFADSSQQLNCANLLNNIQIEANLPPLYFQSVIRSVKCH